MISAEFSAYLQSIGGLKNAYKENDIITNREYFSYGDGWLQLTRDLIEDLIALGWDKQIYQAKEKFGGGRFYISGATNEIFDRINQWEGQTLKTCEDCGTPDDVTTEGQSWILTLCKNCRAASASSKPGIAR